MSGGRLALTASLGRLLPREEFGAFAYTQWLIDFIFLLGSFGITSIGSRFFAEYKTHSPEVFSSFSAWFSRRAIRTLAFTCALTVVAATATSGFAADHRTLLLALWAASNGAFAISVARAQGLQRYPRLVLAYAAYIATTLLFLLTNPLQSTFESAMVGFLAGTLLGALMIWSRAVPASDKTASPGRFAAKNVSTFGINMWIGTAAAAIVWSRGELFIVRSALGMSEVAVYVAALSLLGLAYQSVTMFTGALGPRVAQLQDPSQRAELSEFNRSVTDRLFLLSGIAISFLMLFSSPLLALVFGSAFRSSSIALVVLSAGAASMVSACTNLLVQFHTNGRFTRDTTLLGAVSLIGLAALLVPLFGPIGAALARSSTQLIIGYATFQRARRLIGQGCVAWPNLWKFLLILCIVTITSIKLDQAAITIRSLAFTVTAIVLSLSIRDDHSSSVFFAELRTLRRHLR